MLQGGCCFPIAKATKTQMVRAWGASTPVPLHPLTRPREKAQPWCGTRRGVLKGAWPYRHLLGLEKNKPRASQKSRLFWLADVDLILVVCVWERRKVVGLGLVCELCLESSRFKAACLLVCCDVLVLAWQRQLAVLATRQRYKNMRVCENSAAPHSVRA